MGRGEGEGEGVGEEADQCFDYGIAFEASIQLGFIRAV